MELFYEGLREDVKDEIAKEDLCVGWFSLGSSSGRSTKVRVFSAALKSSSVKSIVDLHDFADEFVKGVGTIFLCYLILHIFSESIVEEFHLAVVLPGEAHVTSPLLPTNGSG